MGMTAPASPPVAGVDELIDRLTLYEHREGYDGKDWEKIASEAAAMLRALASPVGGDGSLQADRQQQF